MRRLIRNVDGQHYGLITNNDGIYSVYAPNGGYVGNIRRVLNDLDTRPIFCPPNTQGVCWRSLGYALTKMVRAKEQKR